MQGVKEKLRANTEEAIKLGICGVRSLASLLRPSAHPHTLYPQAPTYQIGSTLIWGQDKLNVVQDLVLGWKPGFSHLKASVAAFPHFDYRL